jgi:general secretion pathway protein B
MPRTDAPPVAAAPALPRTPETTEVAGTPASSAGPANGDDIAATDLPQPAASEPAAPPAPAPSSVTAAAPEDERLPRLSELTGDERSNLPPLKLTMHVYADEPAQRFVILDGRRLREGESAASGIGVEAIRRDGLVLSVNGRRVLLARP